MINNNINITPIAWLLALTTIASIGTCRTIASDQNAGNDEQSAPAVFPHFVFDEHEEQAKIISNYLQYHFTNRLFNGNTVFNANYLTTSDMWLGGATDPRRGKSIQEVHREDLLSMQIDSEGYVHTHQHYSHAHDHGWPFPLWTQAAATCDGVKGKTVGWHFRKNGDPRWPLWAFLNNWNHPEYFGESATAGWGLENCRSLGIVDNKWRIEATGTSPAIITPAGMEIEAFQAPFLQLRYRQTADLYRSTPPYVEWLREGDTDFGPDRRVYIYPNMEEHSNQSGVPHAMLAMHRHPLWKGKIKRMRIALAPGKSQGQFDIDSFFTVYDTRHPINNPIFILASWDYFRWTGDLDFLRRNINRMRRAMRYQMTEMGGLKHNYILNTWPGHDGIPGWITNEDGGKTVQGGHGIGNNYYDLIPFGWKDCYSTMQYYASLVAMSRLEAAIANHPGWDIPKGVLALDAITLSEHAAAVKETGNRVFWNDKTGRYFACIDKTGKKYDYGFTWLGLEAIWFDFATKQHAQSIMDWIDGRRIVEGDTSTGSDIYRWRFGPRVTTLRNLEWYGQGWVSPESIPWGNQIQDGGAVLGFAFYDLWSRLEVLGSDNAWERFTAICDWEKEVHAAGGYRAYYADGKKGTTLQGGGTAGGIGIDFEFFESSLIPSFITCGLLGINPDADTLHITPNLPAQCPAIAIHNLQYHDTRMNIRATADTVEIETLTTPPSGLTIRFDKPRISQDTDKPQTSFVITKKGRLVFHLDE